MISKLRRAKEIVTEEGILTLCVRSLSFLYRKSLQPYLPRTATTYNGVRVPAARLLDRYVPGVDPRKPDYEQALVKAITDHVTPGDDVVIVGGGWGVTATKAAQRCGSVGSVEVFEGASTAVAHTRKTTNLNNVADRVTVHHAVVNKDIVLGVYDPAKRDSIPNARDVKGEPVTLHPSDLPECDVLELDCEGAELEVLRKLEIEPRAIIVETHAHLGSPPKEIKRLLEERSYEVVSVGTERETRGVYVLASVRTGHNTTTESAR